MEENFLIYFDKEGQLGSEYSAYSDLLKKCIHINAVSMQTTFDISPSVFKQIFEHYSFVEYSKTILSKTIEAVKVELKNRLMKEYPQEYYLNSKLKIENCGHINNCYVNGYVKYCNVHKYEHQELDHEFVYKSPYDAMREYNVQVKYTIYQELITSIANKIKAYIQEIIQSQYTKTEVEPMPILTNWFKEHPLAFKTRAKNKENKIICYITLQDKDSFDKLVNRQ